MQFADEEVQDDEEDAWDEFDIPSELFLPHPYDGLSLSLSTSVVIHGQHKSVFLLRLFIPPSTTRTASLSILCQFSSNVNGTISVRATARIILALVLILDKGDTNFSAVQQNPDDEVQNNDDDHDDDNDDDNDDDDDEEQYYDILCKPFQAASLAVFEHDPTAKNWSSQVHTSILPFEPFHLWDYPKHLQAVDRKQARLCNVPALCLMPCLSADDQQEAQFDMFQLDDNGKKISSRMFNNLDLQSMSWLASNLRWWTSVSVIFLS